MARVMLSARVTEPQAEALKAYAEEAGLPLYQATVRALELGIAQLVSGQAKADSDAPVQTVPASLDEDILTELCDAIERLSTRAELTDRLTQRTLYAAGAAYAAALAPHGEGQEHRAQIAQDADRIFERQLAKAREGNEG